MPLDPILALGALRTVTALLGAVIVAFALKAYRRSRRRTLLFFTSGVGVVTVGFALEGLAFQLLGFPLELVSALEAVFTLVAFGLLVFSLFARESEIVAPALDEAA